MKIGIGFVGTAKGFKKYALPALRKAAMMDLNLKDDQAKIMRMMRQAKAKDVLLQIRTTRPQPAA